MPDGFIASLSDGRTILEKDLETPGAPSPWMQLRALLARDGVHLTQLRLQRGGVILHTLPHAPVYWHSRAISGVMNHPHATREAWAIGAQVGASTGPSAILWLLWVDAAGRVFPELRHADPTDERLLPGKPA